MGSAPPCWFSVWAVFGLDDKDIPKWRLRVTGRFDSKICGLCHASRVCDTSVSLVAFALDVTVERHGKGKYGHISAVCCYLIARPSITNWARRGDAGSTGSRHQPIRSLNGWSKRLKLPRSWHRCPHGSGGRGRGTMRPGLRLVADADAPQSLVTIPDRKPLIFCTGVGPVAVRKPQVARSIRVAGSIQCLLRPRALLSVSVNRARG